MYYNIVSLNYSIRGPHSLYRRYERVQRLDDNGNGDVPILPASNEQRGDLYLTENAISYQTPISNRAYMTRNDRALTRG